MSGLATFGKHCPGLLTPRRGHRAGVILHLPYRLFLLLQQLPLAAVTTTLRVHELAEFHWSLVSLPLKKAVTAVPPQLFDLTPSSCCCLCGGVLFGVEILTFAWA